MMDFKWTKSKWAMLIGVVVALSFCGTALITGGALKSNAKGLEEEKLWKEREASETWNSKEVTKINMRGDDGVIIGEGAKVNDGNLYITEGGDYVLRGSMSDGSLIVEAGKKDVVRIRMDNISISKDNNAAIRLESGEKVYLNLVKDSKNSIASAVEYDQNAAEDGIDGAIFTAVDTVINGTGQLMVNSDYGHGIAAKGNLEIADGNLAIKAKRDGIHAMKTLAIHGGDMAIEASEDGIAVAKGAGGMAFGNTANGGTYYQDGGIVFVTMTCQSGNYALDCDTETEGKCVIDGGFFIGCSNSDQIKGFSGNSGQGFMMMNTNCEMGTVLSMQNAAGEKLILKEVPDRFKNVLVSAPGMNVGEQYTFSVDDITETILVDNSNNVGNMEGTWVEYVHPEPEKPGWNIFDWWKKDEDSEEEGEEGNHWWNGLFGLFEEQEDTYGGDSYDNDDYSHGNTDDWNTYDGDYEGNDSGYDEYGQDDYQTPYNYGQNRYETPGTAGSWWSGFGWY